MGKGSRVPPLSRRAPKAAQRPTARDGSLPEDDNAGPDAAPEHRGEQPASFEAPASLPQRVRGAGDGPQPPARVARPKLPPSMLERVRAAAQAEAEAEAEGRTEPPPSAGRLPKRPRVIPAPVTARPALQAPSSEAPSSEAPATEVPATQAPAPRTSTALPQRVRGAGDGPQPPARRSRPVLPEAYLERVRAAAQAEAGDRPQAEDHRPRAEAGDHRPQSAFTPLSRPARGDSDELQRPNGTAPPVPEPDHVPGDASTEPIPVVSEAASGATLEPAADGSAAPPESAETAEPQAAAAPPRPTGAAKHGAPARARAAPSRKAPATPRALRAAAEGGKRSRRELRTSRGYRMAGLLLVTVILGAVALGLALSHHAGGSGAGQGSAGRTGAGSTRTTPQTPAVTRNVAAAWVATQVKSTALMSCDPSMCRVLKSHGIPARQLLVMKPGMTNPLESDIVVATPVIQGQIGARLSAYAPGLLARFGSGDEQIEVRTIAPHGPAAFMSEVRADRAARKMSGGELALNPRIVASPVARRELAAGDVDSRLMTLITGLAASRPVDIVAFGEGGPDPAAAPFRSAELAETNMHVMLVTVRQQQSPFRATHIASVRLRSGQSVLRVDFSAPSPFGLLGSGPPNSG